jgi:hypothetical protein
MTKEELIEFLKENLMVEVRKEYEYPVYISNDKVYLSVTIRLGERVISKSKTVISHLTNNPLPR